MDVVKMNTLLSGNPRLYLNNIANELSKYLDYKTIHELLTPHLTRLRIARTSTSWRTSTEATKMHLQSSNLTAVWASSMTSFGKMATTVLIRYSTFFLVYLAFLSCWGCEVDTIVMLWRGMVATTLGTCVYDRIMINTLPIYIAIICIVLFATGDGRRFEFCGAIITVGRVWPRS